MLGSPIIKQLIKSQLPSIKKEIGSLEKLLIGYIEKQELEQGETHATAFVEIHKDRALLVVGAFSGKTFVRTIEMRPLADWVEFLLNEFK
jgi:hypothetical protein